MIVAFAVSVHPARSFSSVLPSSLDQVEEFDAISTLSNNILGASNSSIEEPPSFLIVVRYLPTMHSNSTNTVCLTFLMIG